MDDALVMAEHTEVLRVDDWKRPQLLDTSNSIFLCGLLYYSLADFPLNCPLAGITAGVAQ